MKKMRDHFDKVKWKYISKKLEKNDFLKWLTEGCR